MNKLLSLGRASRSTKETKYVDPQQIDPADGQFAVINGQLFNCTDVVVGSPQACSP